MKKYKKLIYVCDQIVDYKLIDLLDEFRIIEDLEIIILKDNRIISKYKNFDIIQNKDYFKDLNDPENKVFILDCDDNDVVISKYLKNISNIELIKINRKSENVYRKESTIPTILISGFSSPELQFELCLKLKKILDDMGEKVFIISNYVNAKVFNVQDLTDLKLNINTNDVIKINEKLNNFYTKHKCSLVIININKTSEIINEFNNFVEDFFIRELIKFAKIDYFINFSPVNFIKLKEVNDNYMMEKYGIKSDFYLYSKEIITNLDIETRNGLFDKVYVKVKQQKNLPEFYIGNSINYYSDNIIEKIISEIINKIGTNSFVKRI